MRYGKGERAGRLCAEKERRKRGKKGGDLREQGSREKVHRTQSPAKATKHRSRFLFSSHHFSFSLNVPFTAFSFLPTPSGGILQSYLLFSVYFFFSFPGLSLIACRYRIIAQGDLSFCGIVPSPHFFLPGAPHMRESPSAIDAQFASVKGEGHRGASRRNPLVRAALAPSAACVQRPLAASLLILVFILGRP